MSEAGFFAPRKVNRTGLVIVVTMHAAAITALALSKMETPPRFVPIITNTWNVPIEPEPLRNEATEVVPSLPHSVTRIVKLRIPEPEVEQEAESFDPVVMPEPPVLSQIEEPAARPIDPPRPPIEIAAAADPRANFQPAYPPSEQRAGGEGVVKVRVLIGADGRVKTVEKVSATSEAFWRATERHALRNWRFRAATRDGRAVESWREMTVRFELSAEV